jgi:hypothetical protein
MEDPTLIATLVAVDRKAEIAFRLPHNNERYLPPQSTVQQTSDRSPDSAHRLRLAFDNLLMKDPAQGFSFGSDPKSCDVLLGGSAKGGIGGVYFYITLNDRGRLVLKNRSSAITVRYDGGSRIQVQRHRSGFVLDPARRDIEVQVFKNGTLAFKVLLARHDNNNEEYQKVLNNFLERARAANPPIGLLGIGSFPATIPLNDNRIPRTRYGFKRRIGCGGFGTVDLVVDPHTGKEYARKKFHGALQQQSLAEIKQEIENIGSHPHVRIALLCRIIKC